MPLTFTTLGTPILMALATNPKTKVAQADSSLALPHLVYTVAIEDVRQALWRPIGPIATRILQISDGMATNAYEISAGPDGMPQINSTMVSGPDLQSTLDLIERCERLAGDRSFEFRLLRAPFLHLTFAWLHTAEEDLFLPFGDLGPDASPVRNPWNTEELMGALQARAGEMDRLSAEAKSQTNRPRRGD